MPDPYSDKEIELIKQYYAVMPTFQLCKLLNEQTGSLRTVGSVNTKAKTLKLKKNLETITKMRRCFNNTDYPLSPTKEKFCKNENIELLTRIDVKNDYKYNLNEEG